MRLFKQMSLLMRDVSTLDSDERGRQIVECSNIWLDSVQQSSRHQTETCVAELTLFDDGLYFGLICLWCMFQVIEMAKFTLSRRIGRRLEPLNKRLYVY